MQYKIVLVSKKSKEYSTTYLANKVEIEVNRLMFYGWKPQGGVATIFRDDKVAVMQAMVKEDIV